LLEVGPIQDVSLAPNHAGRVLEITRPPGEQLVDDEVLGAGEGHGYAAERREIIRPVRAELRIHQPGVVPEGGEAPEGGLERVTAPGLPVVARLESGEGGRRVDHLSKYTRRER